MAFALATLLAFNVLQPIVDVLRLFLSSIYGVVHNYGWSLIILAALVKTAMWPLNTMQFKGMLAMQELQPKIKALQAKHKGDKEKLNEATMALYKEKGANPVAGCLPMILQLPVLYSVFYAITSDKTMFSREHWLWIGSPISAAFPHVLASSLAASDYVLLALYVISMYFSVRFTSPPSPDPQMAQQQRIMAFISPVMIGFLGVRFGWPSGLIIYWLSFNLFTMAQQIYLIRKYHRNPTAVGPHAELAAGGAAVPALGSNAAKSSNGTPSGAVAANGSTGGGGGGSRAARRRRSSRR